MIDISGIAWQMGFLVAVGLGHVGVGDWIGILTGFIIYLFNYDSLPTQPSDSGYITILKILHCLDWTSANEYYCMFK